MPFQGFPVIMAAGGRSSGGGLTPFEQGINFRATADYVTDISPDTYEISESVNYPRTTPQGNSVGWEAAPTGIQVRNRNAGNNPELAGCNFINLDSEIGKYRIDLIAAGTYSIRWAAGEANYAASVVASLYDDSSLLTALSTGSTSAAQRFKDATDTEYTNVTWPTDNTAISQVFASTICRVQTLGTVNCFFAHLGVVRTA